MEKKQYTTRQRIRRLTVAAVLAALSLVLMLTFRFPIFTEFYELEFSDFPLLLCASLVGPGYGMIALFIVCFIQALTVSSFSGIIGFVMHLIASGAMIFVVYFIKKKVNGVKGAFLSTVCGMGSMTLIMIPMNIWLTSVFMSLPMSEFISGYLGVCIGFNLIKSGCNIALYHVLFPLLKKQYEKLIRR